MRKLPVRLRAVSETLESRRLFAAAVVGGWSALDKLPAARGVTTDLKLDGFKAYTLAAGTISNSLSKAPVENVAKYGIGRGAGSRLISVPTPEGGYAQFRIVESAILTGADAKKFTNIKTYAGVGVDDPSASIRLDYTPLGFHAQVLSPKTGRYYVEPYYKGATSVYASYYGTAVRKTRTATPESDMVEAVEDRLAAQRAAIGERTTGNASVNSLLRTYRTAVAATAEYTAYFGGTVAAGQAAIVSAVNRVTGIYEYELGIRLTLVGNNSSLVFTNATTDGYSNTDGGAMLSQNQTKVDSIIGAANYDIGHVFSTGGGGVAYLGVVGEPGYKAGGVTGSGAPTGDAFWVDYVAHEMGHQFGGDHTFDTSQDGNREDANAYEPGSGSTIMGYAGIEGNEDLQANSDPYFSFASVNQILTYVDVTRPSTGTRVTTTNFVPTVNGGSNYTIPANTPFTLTATGSDANGDAVYYSWEQADLGNNSTGKLLSAVDDGSSPLFRVYNPTTSPSRTFPRLASVLTGATTTQARYAGRFAERLPTTSRTMKFVVTARDLKGGGGGTNVPSGTVNVTSVAAASGFAITNFASTTALTGGSAQTISWNVAGTTGNGINTANVSILMSTDNGQTFAQTLAASTANDGTETVTLPTGLTSSQVRFKVAAVGNIFFDINNAALSITPGSTAVSATPGVPDLAAASDSGISNTDNLTNFNNASAGRAPQYTVTGTVAGATVTVLADTTVIGTAVATGTTTTVTGTGAAAVADGLRSITARQTESGKTASAASGALSVVIDTAAPALSGQPVFSYVTNKPRVTFNYTEAIAAAPAGNFGVLNNDTATPVAFTATISGAAVALTFPGSPNGVLANGNYSSSTAPASVTDAAGNITTGGGSTTFFVLAGDANRDRVTDFNDFLTLQTNFGTSVLDFTKGDFNYDGKVDFNDFLELQTNFGTTV